MKDRCRYDFKPRMVSYALVMGFYAPVQKVGISEKLLKRYFNPYQALIRLPHMTCEVQDSDLSYRRKILFTDYT